MFAEKTKHLKIQKQYKKYKSLESLEKIKFLVCPCGTLLVTCRGIHKMCAFRYAGLSTNSVINHARTQSMVVVT